MTKSQFDQRTVSQRAVSDSGSSTNTKALRPGRSSSRATTVRSQSQLGQPAANKTEIELGPEEEKLLMFWYLRVRDAASENPILEDQHAKELMEKIQFDISRKSFRLDPTYVQYVCGRTKQMDRWAQDFLDQHTYEDVLVVQLACGLDTRGLRLKRNMDRDVKWIDVDRPRVTGLRRKLIPPAGPECGDYTLMTALVGEDDGAWLRKIPTDRPALIVIEALTYYLEPEQGRRLFRRLLDHFPHANLIFDTLGSLGVVFTSLVESVRKVDSRIRWGIDDASEITKLDDRLVLRNRIFSHEYMDAGPFAKGYPPMFGGWTPIISLLPNFKKNGQFLHFEW